MDSGNCLPITSRFPNGGFVVACFFFLGGVVQWHPWTFKTWLRKRSMDLTSGKKSTPWNEKHTQKTWLSSTISNTFFLKRFHEISKSRPKIVTFLWGEKGSSVVTLPALGNWGDVPCLDIRPPPTAPAMASTNHGARHSSNVRSLLGVDFFFWKHGGWCDNDKMYICM